MLTVKEAIESRRSIRKFKSEAISENDITKLFELVRLAPSAWNVQPWRYHLVTSEDVKQKLQDAAYGQKQITSAPAVIVVTSDMEDTLNNLRDVLHPGMPEERKDQEVQNLSGIFNNMSIADRGQWGLTQTNIALGFLLLTIQGMGYSSVPMLGFEAEKVKSLLEIPEHANIAAIVPFGVADEDGFPHHRHAVDTIVTRH
ncbi:nitroreductase family protein [Paenalkalicoccus suaedae]|uniref:Nitroreductase family protein n=1 Tax=Paenalkalicoccus suaedae TaxID=2592382 RepID=A0A859FK27_9BACI|nr:nitroreductase family protein [Paenalkalicoccus suaedae]